MTSPQGNLVLVYVAPWSLGGVETGVQAFGANLILSRPLTADSFLHLLC